jgi:hypothetical protein
MCFSGSHPTSPILYQITLLHPIIPPSYSVHPSIPNVPTRHTLNLSIAQPRTVRLCPCSLPLAWRLLAIKPGPGVWMKPSVYRDCTLLWILFVVKSVRCMVTSTHTHTHTHTWRPKILTVLNCFVALTLCSCSAIRCQTNIPRTCVRSTMSVWKMVRVRCSGWMERYC